MPVDSRTMQPDRILHGGASVALAETLGSVGGSMCVDRERFQIVGHGDQREPPAARDRRARDRPRERRSISAGAARCGTSRSATTTKRLICVSRLTDRDHRTPAALKTVLYFAGMRAFVYCRCDSSCIAGCLLAACGQTGSLYLPDEGETPVEIARVEIRTHRRAARRARNTPPAPVREPDEGRQSHRAAGSPPG